jgi:3-oxoacyl-[acyl-carrier protein] reductase
MRMDLGIRDKVAIVAASSKGLGKASALALAGEGVKLTVCARGEEALHATAQEIGEKTGVEVLPMVVDVTHKAQIDDMVKATMDKFGKVDILVTNAGGPPPVVSFLDVSDQGWREGIDLNLMSTINMCRAAVPHMKAQGWGRIVNIMSVSVKQPLDGLLLSNVSRTGVVGFSKTISNELASENITVNTVCPGAIMTDRVKSMTKARAENEGKSEEEILSSYTSIIPMGRIGQPRELGSLVAFLASELASYITGTVIQIDGGLDITEAEKCFGVATHG